MHGYNNGKGSSDVKTKFDTHGYLVRDKDMIVKRDVANDVIVELKSYLDRHMPKIATLLKYQEVANIHNPRVMKIMRKVMRQNIIVPAAEHSDDDLSDQTIETNDFLLRQDTGATNATWDTTDDRYKLIQEQESLHRKINTFVDETTDTRVEQLKIDITTNDGTRTSVFDNVEEKTSEKPSTPRGTDPGISNTTEEQETIRNKKHFRSLSKETELTNSYRSSEPIKFTARNQTSRSQPSIPSMTPSHSIAIPLQHSQSETRNPSQL